MQDLFTPETPIAEAGRQILAAQLAIIFDHEVALLQTEETAVHETRKAIRRSFTAYRLFAPYFKEETFDPFRWRLKKLMRRLGRCRDLTVFLQKLAYFQETAPQNAALQNLVSYWESQKTAADIALRYYLEKPKRQTFWRQYETFLHTPGRGVASPTNPFQPVKVKYVTPLLIFQAVTAVRAFDDVVGDASLEQLHQLRLQMKELRYTLEFFAPLLGPDIGDVLLVVKQTLEHLGHLNDAHVATRLFQEVNGLETAVSLYRTAKEEEIAHLTQTFIPLWHSLNSAQWRQQLATAVAVL